MKIKRVKGSTTIETAIILPFFLIILFSLATIIKIFYAYNTVQVSLAETARSIGNASYFYYISGLKDYSDRLDEMSDNAENKLESQKNTVIEAFTFFNNTISGFGETVESDANSIDDLIQLVDNAQGLNDSIENVNELVQTIISNPEDELKMFMTLFARKLNYETQNSIVCAIAKEKLGAELYKRVKSQEDAALALGIRNGINGIDFSKSSVFGDGESLEFNAQYKVKAPILFSAIIPEIKLSNKVKIIAWTGGRGKSVMASDENIEEEEKVDESLWMVMDQDQRYYDRGLEIEKLTIEKLIKQRKDEGFDVYATSSGYPVIDAYSYNLKTKEAEYYDVFTLNPFMKTYSENTAAICSAVKKHGKRLMECKKPDYFKELEVKSIKRVVILVVPENSYPEEIVKNAQDYLKKYNTEVMLVKGYGTYTPADQTENADEAA